MQTKFSQAIFQRGVTVFCCVCIIVFGITLLSKADPITTSIGQDISTNNLSLSGSVTSGTWAGSNIDVAHGGTGQNWSTATQGSFPYFSGTGALSTLTPGTAGQFLQSGGVGASPSWGNVTRSATFVIAASDSAVKSKQQADYVCDGTDDNVEIQAAIDALPANGGSVLLLEGIYNINSSIRIAISNIALEGQGNGTILKLANGANTNVIIVGNGATSFIQSISIKKISIDGNKSNQTSTSSGILFDRKVKLSFLEDLVISNCYTDGISLHGTSILDGCPYNNIMNSIIKDCGNNGITDEYGHHLIISGCSWIGGCLNDGVYLLNSNSWMITNTFIAQNTDACLKLSGSYSGQAINVNLTTANYDLWMGTSSTNSFTNCVFEDSNITAAYLTASSSINMFTGCYFPYGKQQLVQVKNSSDSNSFVNCNFGNGGSQTNNTYDDIFISAASRNVIEHNMFKTIQTPSNKPRYAISEAGASDYNKIANNIFYPTTQFATGLVTTIGVNTQIKNNEDYITERSGTSTITTGQTFVTVSHGLATTPTRVQLTPTTDTAGKRYWISAKTATTFTITIDSTYASDITFDWRGVVGEGN